MTTDQALAFAVIGGMMAMFVWNRLRYDLVALLGLLTAVASGVVPDEEAFSGFSDPGVVIVASVLVISAGVGKSNAIGRIIRHPQPYMRTTGRQVLVLTSGVPIMSAFVKNIGALAILLPIAVQVARRSGTAPSKLLMPMAFGSLIGGLTTLVGTSPNILVSRVRSEVLGVPFGMFDFAPVGLGVVAAGLAFLSVGWRLLPGDRRAQTSAAAAFEVQPYLFEAVSLALVAAMALTPFLNNAATVLIMAPVGASLAGKLGLHAEPFLMAVALGAACDFPTPIGHQCNTLVMGPGGYRFGDYWRLGLPLSIIVIVVGTALIPLFWRFEVPSNTRRSIGARRRQQRWLTLSRNPPRTPDRLGFHIVRARSVASAMQDRSASSATSPRRVKAFFRQRRRSQSA